MKKWQIENSEFSEISETSEILFQVFFFPGFRFLPYSQNQKLGFKNLGKIFPRFPRFPSFSPGPY